MNHLLDREFSLPTVNWLRFGAPPGGVGDPEPVWPLEAVLDGAAAAGFTRVGLDLYTVRDYLARGGRIGDIVGELRSRGLACTDVGVLPLGATDVGSATEALA